EDQKHFAVEATPLAERAILNFESSGLVAKFVWLDGGTTLRNLYATLSNQQRKPSFKFGASDEFGSAILLLSNKVVQLMGSQCLPQAKMTHRPLQKKNGASARQPKLPSIVSESLLHEWGDYAAGGCARDFKAPPLAPLVRRQRGHGGKSHDLGP